jgi:hypothetical protein
MGEDELLVVGGWVGTIRVHCEARDPCHAPQISHPIHRAELFLPTVCIIATSPVVGAKREKLQNASHTVPAGDEAPPLSLTAVSGGSILVAATRCRHIIMATTRSACGGQVP